MTISLRLLGLALSAFAGAPPDCSMDHLEALQGALVGFMAEHAKIAEAIQTGAKKYQAGAGRRQARLAAISRKQEAMREDLAKAESGSPKAREAAVSRLTRGLARAKADRNKVDTEEQAAREPVEDALRDMAALADRIAAFREREIAPLRPCTQNAASVRLLDDAFGKTVDSLRKTSLPR